MIPLRLASTTLREPAVALFEQGLDMELQAILTVAAILLAPLTALQVSVWLGRRRAKREKRLEIFRTLMTTRASGLAPSHVQALNLIDVDFFGDDKSSKTVLLAWKAYVNHLNQDSNTVGLDVWAQKKGDLFVDLMYAMARDLGYDFDKTDLKTTSYFPKGHGEAEDDQLAIRRGLGQILAGKWALPVLPVTLEQLQGKQPIEGGAGPLPNVDAGGDLPVPE